MLDVVVVVGVFVPGVDGNEVGLLAKEESLEEREGTE